MSELNKQIRTIIDENIHIGELDKVKLLMLLRTLDNKHAVLKRVIAALVERAERVQEGEDWDLAEFILWKARGQMNEISPLQKLVRPDYKSMCIDLLMKRRQMKDYIVCCSQCEEWIPANRFKHHIRKEHEFDWWDMSGKHFEKLGEYISIIRIKDALLTRGDDAKP